MKLIRLIYDLINYLNLKGLPGFLLFLDFEIPQLFWFWKRCVRTFYKDIYETAVIVNVQITQWFNTQRGCRHGEGDLISPYLFILCVDILAIMIREDEVDTSS